jgi:hypothetical protein
LNKEVWKAENAAVGFDVLNTRQPSTVWCSRERLPAAAAQPAKVRQSCSATDKKQGAERAYETSFFIEFKAGLKSRKLQYRM